MFLAGVALCYPRTNPCSCACGVHAPWLPSSSSLRSTGSLIDEQGRMIGEYCKKTGRCRTSHTPGSLPSASTGDEALEDAGPDERGRVNRQRRTKRDAEEKEEEEEEEEEEGGAEIEMEQQGAGGKRREKKRALRDALESGTDGEERGTLHAELRKRVADKFAAMAAGKKRSALEKAFDKGGFLTFRDDELPDMPGVLTFNPRSKSWEDADAAAELVRADANASQIALHVAAAEAAAEGEEAPKDLRSFRRQIGSKKEDATEQDVQAFFEMASQAGLRPPARAGAAGSLPMSPAEQVRRDRMATAGRGAEGAGGSGGKGSAGAPQAGSSGAPATAATGAYERALRKKLRHIDALLQKQEQGAALDEKQRGKVSRRPSLLAQLASCQAPGGGDASHSASHSPPRQLPRDAALPQSSGQPPSEETRRSVGPVGSAHAGAGGANGTGADTLDGAGGQVMPEAAAAGGAKSSPWATLGLDPRLVLALHALSFDAPTPIQNVSLHGINTGRDVIGIAETGAGKTLAYGLAIINHLLCWPGDPAVQGETAGGQAGGQGGSRGLRALIICPTRELALQVTEHLNEVLKKVWTDAARPKAVPLVGGLAEVKQVKRLSKRPAIVVATPGRLWALLQAGDKHLNDGLKSLRFIVLDEGDRLMESGHFKDLMQILKLLPPARKVHIDGRGHAHPVEDDDASSSEDEALAAKDFGQGRQKSVVRQAMLFTATFTVPDPLARARPATEGEGGDTAPKDGRNRGQDTRRGKRPLSRGGTVRQRRSDGRAPQDEEDEGWEGLSFRAAMRAKGRQARQTRGKAAARNMVKLARKLLKMPAKPLVLHADAQQRVVSSRVKQYVIKCRHEDKDLFLFFFLRNNPGRSIVFVNNIGVLRRVAALLQRLKLGARAVHASMQQRARLKSLEHFSAHESGVLVATDVAARGLDIPLVQHVLHYDVPVTADIYTHRSGRAAHQPGADTGYSVLLADRRDDKMWAKVRNLTGDFAGVRQVGAHSSQFKSLQRPVKLARKLVASAAQQSKRASEQSWKAKMAEELEIVVDSEGDAASDEAGGAPAAASERVAQKNAVAELEADLAAELASLGKTSFEVFLAKDVSAPQNATVSPGAGQVQQGTQRKAAAANVEAPAQGAVDKRTGARAQARSVQADRTRLPRKEIIVGGRSQLDRFRPKPARKAQGIT